MTTHDMADVLLSVVVNDVLLKFWLFMCLSTVLCWLVEFHQHITYS
ncbi:hypothetical protein H0E87_023031 [Populus deltoides]|uniref:Uncharacterized protein n=1 Tax=Populus deltoides TaxID=3696 RepID=A0A8T2XB15_POPDE|nr:hypothetical protein H0E87_023031 [Populus deltoides]